MYVCQPIQDYHALARAELATVFHTTSIADTQNISVVSKNGLLYIDSNVAFDYERLALIKRVCYYYRIGDSAADIDIDFCTPSGSFAVRQTYVTGSEPCEAAIGRRIQQKTGASVDLETPHTLYRIFTLDKHHILCEELWQRKYKEYAQRKNAYRPYQQPVAMHPIWCRVLVNLASVTTKTTVLDPFCGTGGLLIEAGSLNARVYGADADEQMVRGTQLNLRHYGCERTIVHSPIQQLAAHLSGPFDAIVTALPYGRASYTEGDVIEPFLTYAEQHCHGPIICASDQPTLYTLQPAYAIYQHSSLTNYIYVTNASELQRL